MKVSVSFLSSLYPTEETIVKINRTDADYIHVDVMDGEFVAVSNFKVDELKSILKDSEKKLDVHLMCKNPKDYIDNLVGLNIDSITIHCEIPEVKDTLKLIKEKGFKCGIAVNPSTEIESISALLNEVDLVLIMSVVPGAGGQAFMFSSVEKIETLKRCQGDCNFEIYVDGGINDETVQHVKNCDCVVSGSFVCQNENFQGQIDKLRGNENE